MNEEFKMKFILTSDLHAGFSHNTVKIHQKFFQGIAKDPVTYEEGFGGLIIAGDLISHKQRSLRTLFRTIRESLACPVYVVWGNHDYWDDEHDFGFETFKSMREYREHLCTEFNVHDLNQGIVRLPLSRVVVIGFDSWYGHPNPPTNDYRFMINHDAEGVSTHQTFRELAQKNFEFEMSLPENFYGDAKKILVTHFPSFTSDRGGIDHAGLLGWMDKISERFDFYCVGHSHKYEDSIIGRCRVLNAGSDYDKPAYKVFEI